MARKEAEKPMLPVRAGVPCAADANCPNAGRMWLRTLPHDERICVPHYYRAVEADRSLAMDPVVPPRVVA